MGLSFFGRKRPAELQPDSAKPSSFATPAPISEGENLLDPPTELSALDFSDGGIGRGLVTVAGEIQVEEMGSGIGAVFEEAAILYANGSEVEAEQVLAAVLDDARTSSGEGLWMMLLDLYRLTGQKDKFEKRVLDFATRFERSPPSWEDLSGRPVKSGAERIPSLGLSGDLAGSGQNQFAQIAVLGRRAGAIRLDLGRLRGLSDEACAALLGALNGLAAERVNVSLLNVGQLIDELTPRTLVGEDRQRERWLLLLELLQHGGDQAVFEERAIDYAVTFEESPPSWVGPTKAAAAAAPAVHPVSTPVAEGVLALEGELSGSAAEPLKRLATKAGERVELKVDCDRLRRLDFVSAGVLFNLLATLKAQGKQITLINVNAMVAALLRVMSVDQVAHVTLRR